MSDEGSQVLARGYRFAGVHCGLRPDPNRLDLALVVSDRSASAAGAFTQNRVVAAPVRICRQRVPAADARAIVICSGNANACTGKQGLADARRMAAAAAEAVGCKPEQVLPCSTGVIGVPLPMSPIEAGIQAASSRLAGSRDALEQAARAILTTDTRIKVSSKALTLGGADVRITGFAKGAAMIGPNMATLLAFVMTDAAVSPDSLTRLAPRAARETFNCTSVEGHASTNDTVLILANGPGPTLEGSQLAAFESAALAVCAELARSIVEDAEGAAHVITIHVEGLLDDGAARQVAKTVAESALVKTAVFGADPNWGRFVSAAGYAGVPFEEEQLSCWLGDILLYQAGAPVPFDKAQASAYLKNNREVELRLRFTLGTGRCTFWTSDLTYDYVRLNAEYTT